MTIDELANEIRRVDGNHSLGAGALAEALMPFLLSAAKPVADDEIEAIRGRHYYDAKNVTWSDKFGSALQAAREDRAALLRALDEEREARVKAEEIVRLFMGAATPVSTDIDPRGYCWSLAYLDQARAATLAKETP